MIPDNNNAPRSNVDEAQFEPYIHHSFVVFLYIMQHYTNITSFRGDNRVHRVYRYVATGECKHLWCCAHHFLHQPVSTVHFVSVCCVCSQGQPQPARASPSQAGPGAQPAASQAGPQLPGKAQPGTRKKQEVAESQSHNTSKSLVTPPGDLGVF